MVKKEKILLFFILAVAILYFLPSVSSANVCCEKTLSGAICQDTTSDNCAPGAAQNPTSCSQTSFCRLGTCIDNKAGECKPNTPQKACEGIGGFWDQRIEDEISQCQKVCCYIGGKATFVTQTECKTLSGLYGFETVSDKTIKNALECLASGISEDKGACVFDEEAGFGKTCEFTTEKKCRDMKTAFPDLNTEFFKDYLCSAEELGTNCAQSKKTTCNNEKVYFLDNCGNLANIYDASKLNDNAYWSKIIEPGDSCGFGSSNADSKSCGNCNYNLGSTCSEAKRGETTIPTAGDFICRDLSCEYDNNGDKKMEQYQHGERWCATISGTSKIISDKEAIPNSFKENLPGSEYIVLSCNNGEVDYEQCLGARQEICIENTIYPDGITPFRNAICSPNLWKDCTSISSKEECEDIEKRDCKWIPILARTDDDRLTTWKPNQEGDAAPLIKIDSDLPVGKGNTFLVSSKNQILDLIKRINDVKIDINNYKIGNEEEDRNSDFQNGVCVPRYAPGFDFMAKASGGSEEDMKKLREEAQDICSLASAKCVIKQTKKIGGSWKSVENSECEPDLSGTNGPYLWLKSMKNICYSLGDCGATLNYEGDKGDIKTEFIGPEEWEIK